MKELVKLFDTNVILRYLLADEPRLYEKARKLLEDVRIGEDKAVILESVLVESVYVLTKFYRVPREEASFKLKELLHYKGIVNDDKELLVEALMVFAKCTLDIVDCILCAKSHGYNMQLFSFDEGTNKKYRAVLKDKY